MIAEDRYDSLIQYYAGLKNLDWLAIKAQIKQESAFDPDAINPRSLAIGLGQFMARTWEEWRDGTAGIQSLPDKGQLPRADDPEDSIRATCAYMHWLLKQFNFDQRKALAAYNWGIGNLKRMIAGLPEEIKISWVSFLPAETANYLVRINRYYVEYQHEELKKGRTGQT